MDHAGDGAELTGHLAEQVEALLEPPSAACSTTVRVVVESPTPRASMATATTAPPARAATNEVRKPLGTYEVCGGAVKPD